ncbi:gluconokinase [Caldibacillus lycopersici]|uniref:Gluconokinase n=1 Tax=Perspicuibacillus lycopersici TaxID=1325689 RepID=A0AAE3IXH3_9BACI|nr:gluconokinase [Perspicuibacillus lycopersici]MCU9615184.1 gluconokinase [Perspicuibacillus lycopersici]
MTRRLIIGLDIGTTSVKAVLFTLQGKQIADAEQMLTTYYPQAGWVEQDPKEVERAAVAMIRDVIEKAGIAQGELLGVGISCAMHSLICLDADYEPLSHMLIWSDGRSSEIAESVKDTIGASIFLKTGTPIHPMSPFLKLLWMKENQFTPYENAAYFMTAKEYILHKWFGKRVVDYAMASSTGLLNLSTLDWDEEALSIVGVQKEQLSDIVPPTEILVDIDDEIAKDIGISRKLPFVIGSADGQLANLGSGAILPGEVNVSVGTSGAIRQFANGFPINENRGTFTYAFTKDTSIIGGPTNNGGIALQWVKDFLSFSGTHDQLLHEADHVAPGASGLIFHPYINGERAPLWNQQAKGNLFGLAIGHKREHVVRAVLEGIAFNIYQISKSLTRLVGPPKKITVNGGLTRSQLWVQIMADVFGQDIYLSETHHNAAWGAAWTALVAIGEAESFAAIKENLPKEKVTHPNMENYMLYKEIYNKYEKIGESLWSFFR